MRAGDLDRRIELQSAVEVPDISGEPIKTWVTYAEVWAAVRPLSGTERFESLQLKASADTRMQIRHRSDVTPKTRVLHDGRVYDVSAVLEIGRHEGLELLTQARAE